MTKKSMTRMKESHQVTTVSLKTVERSMMLQLLREQKLVKKGKEVGSTSFSMGPSNIYYPSI